MEKGTEAQKLIWEGAIPLQVHLHESEVTTLPPPPPAMILAPRIGYLPLLVPQIKPLFSSALPPGVDTVWFEYKGLALKWYIPTGVLFDLSCAEAERPWNLKVHFRGYPADILTPCEDEDAVKWSFINSLKEAAYIINGNCKNVMNMSQSDQLELWRSILNGNLEVFLRISSKLKLGAIEDEFTEKLNPSLKKSKTSVGNTDNPGSTKTGRIPVRLYVRIVAEEVDDLEDSPEIGSWDQVIYINRPVDIHKGKCFSLGDVLRSLLPEYSGDCSDQVVEEKVSPEDASSAGVADEAQEPVRSEDSSEDMNVAEKQSSTACEPAKSRLNTFDKIKLVRIQGIEPKMEIPFSWVVNNFINPDFFLHICVYIKI